jgi:hypothetical protein
MDDKKEKHRRDKQREQSKVYYEKNKSAIRKYNTDYLANRREKKRAVKFLADKLNQYYKYFFTNE